MLCLLRTIRHAVLLGGIILLIFPMMASDVRAQSGSSPWTMTAQFGAFAPNAGGQKAYALRAFHAEREYSLFANTYLLAGGIPLIGGVYSWRFSVCDESCWWQFFAQLGAGGSTAGPIGEITWGTVIPLLPLWLPRASPRFIPALRLDITTQVIGIRNRLVMWSYPLWLGIAVPL